ncbi:MAG TPA: MFS transporter [Actinomycetota bacterium]|nr:MFS transporter [Actinomycetota bacterium]
MLKRGAQLLVTRRDFGLLMATQFCAQAGDGVVQAALAKLIVFGGQKGFDLEGARSPDDLLRIALYVFVPYTILSPFLGVVIDRWDRRKLLMVANGLRAVIIAIVGVMGTASVGEAGVFLAFLLTLSSTRLVLATKAAALPAALDGEFLVEGNAVSQLGGALFQLVGAAFALVAAGVVSARPIVVIGAVVYGLGAIAASALRHTGETRPGTRLSEEIARVFHRIEAGVREVARIPRAAASISTYFWLRLLWSFSIAGIGLISRELLVNQKGQVALTAGAGAAGAVLGFLLAGRLRALVRTTAHLVLAGAVTAGVAVAVLGTFDHAVALALLAFLLGLGFFVAKISLDTMVQEALGDGFRGRAFSLYDIAYNLAWVLAAAAMKLFWSQDAQGALMAGMGLVFLAGMALIGLWFTRAGLLTDPLRA